MSGCHPNNEGLCKHGFIIIKTGESLSKCKDCTQEENQGRQMCICNCHSGGVPSNLLRNPPIPCCACRNELSGKLSEIDMQLCSHGRILMMNDCYYCKADKEKLDILKRVMTLENFVGQNYMRDMDALASRLEDVERGLENYREYETGIEDLETDVMYIKQRLDKLEGYMEMEDRVTASDILIRLSNLQGKWGNILEEKVLTLEKTINQLIDKIAEIGNHYYRERQEPFKCPACNGWCHFKLSNSPILSLAQKCIRECSKCSDMKQKCSHCIEILDSIKEMEKCKACEGKGVLWK